MKWAVALACASLILHAQETPPNNRMVWFGILPEPMPEGVNAIALEASSQFLRPDLERSRDGRAYAMADGEDWQLTWDLAMQAGPGRLNLRLRGEERSGGIGDQAIWNYHNLFGFPQGGRQEVPKNRLTYTMVKDGVTVASLRTSGFHLMDTDIAYVVPFGDRLEGGRLGASVQVPTGNRHDWSGDGGMDGLLGAAAWKAWGPWRLHAQVERVDLVIPRDSPFQSVLAQHTFSRAWAGGGWQGTGPGFWGGLGLDLTLGYFESPYRVGIPRVDRPGWQQHWIFTHRSLPRWRFGLSEDAGTYTNPDITLFAICRL